MDQETLLLSDMWEPIKGVVRKYYVDEGRSYSEVIQPIQELCHVKVTKHQLARQICRWNFQKRIKLKKLRSMAKVCGLRALLNHKRTTFVVREILHRSRNPSEIQEK